MVPLLNSRISFKLALRMASAGRGAAFTLNDELRLFSCGHIPTPIRLLSTD